MLLCSCAVHMAMICIPCRSLYLSIDICRSWIVDHYLTLSLTLALALTLALILTLTLSRWPPSLNRMQSFACPYAVQVMHRGLHNAHILYEMTPAVHPTIPCPQVDAILTLI